MATRDTVIPPYNSIRLTPHGITRPARYHRGNLDDTFAYDLRLPWQEDTVYKQKIERGVRFRFQCSTTADITSGTASISLEILDCNGYSLFSIPRTKSATIAGNVTADGTQLYAHLFKMADFSAIPVDGTYYIVLRVAYDSTDIRYWKSEPLLIQDTHEGTINIEYWHSENKPDFFFEQLPARLSMCVEAYVSNLEPASVDTIYEDQNQNPQQLDSTAYRGWTLFVGYTGEGIPEWMLDKLNWIFSLDTVYLNGKQYEKGSAGAKWATTGEEGVLFAASYPLREADNQEGFSFINATLAIFTVPAAYPYALQNLYVNNTLLKEAVVHNSTEQTALLATLNAALGDYELFGTITQTGNVVSYNPAQGEVISSAGALVYTTNFSFTYTKPASIPPVVLTFQYGIGGIVVEWGQGPPDSYLGNPLSITPNTASHSYPGGASTTYTVIIWGQTTLFAIADPAIRGLTGTLPGALQTLDIRNAAFTSNTFNFNLLTPCMATIQTVIIMSCGLTTVTWGAGLSFPALLYLNFSYNSLSSSSFNGLVVSVYNNASGNLLYFGSLSMVGQSPAVSYTLTGSLRRGALISTYSWSVNP